MKKLIKVLCLFLILSSCVKEPMYPPCTTVYPTTQNNGNYVETNFLDGCWVLQSGTMYVQNLDTDENNEVFLFGGGETTSLRYGGASLFPIETLVRYQTTWCFDFPDNIPGNGSFTLNGDSVYPYGLNVTTNNITVTEDISGNYQLLGGSSRPIHYEVVNVESKIINIYIQEVYENLDGYNYYYFSKLKFKKQ